MQDDGWLDEPDTHGIPFALPDLVLLSRLELPGARIEISTAVPGHDEIMLIHRIGPRPVLLATLHRIPDDMFVVERPSLHPALPGAKQGFVSFDRAVDAVRRLVALAQPRPASPTPAGPYRMLARLFRAAPAAAGPLTPFDPRSSRVGVPNIRPWRPRDRSEPGGPAAATAGRLTPVGYDRPSGVRPP